MPLEIGGNENDTPETEAEGASLAEAVEDDDLDLDGEFESRGARGELRSPRIQGANRGRRCAPPPVRRRGALPGRKFHLRPGRAPWARRLRRPGPKLFCNEPRKMIRFSRHILTQTGRNLPWHKVYNVHMML